MKLSRHDLNLLVYLDALLRERNVTRAADRLNISQPAMSNGLKRLREMFSDPLLVRTSRGMEPTARALALQPAVHQMLLDLEAVLQDDTPFDPGAEDRVFRIMASDYAATTLLPGLMERISSKAPNIRLDIMTPSDVSFRDVEDGRVDLAINSFSDLPQSFYQKVLWRDAFICAVPDSDAADELTLESYLAAHHVWVNKTGYGVGMGIDPEDIQRLSRVDRTLHELGHRRTIKLFARDYHLALHLVFSAGLVATVPRRIAASYRNWPGLTLMPPPFPVEPLELSMVWSPLLHQDQAHIWMRKAIAEVADAEVPGVTR